MQVLILHQTLASDEQSYIDTRLQTVQQIITPNATLFTRSPARARTHAPHARSRAPPHALPRTCPTTGSAVDPSDLTHAKPHDMCSVEQFEVRDSKINLGNPGVWFPINSAEQTAS